jgi:hypothetical protein
MLAGLFAAGFVPPVRSPPLIFPSDGLLRPVRMPVQVLLAGNAVHDSAKGLRRVQAVLPPWRYHLWPNASHALPDRAAG